MLKIIDLKTENLTEGCVTDSARPRFSFALAADGKNVRLKAAKLSVSAGGETVYETLTDSQSVAYGGSPLAPFTEYTVKLAATDNRGETAEAETRFETGRLGTPWTAVWISDPEYVFTEKRVSPVPMEFRKRLLTGGNIVSAKIYVTAMGIYELKINGKKVGRDYFAPGFTSYKTRLQYQTYDVTDMLTGDDEIDAVVSGGWAVGSFVFTRKNRVSADRQALLLELRVRYADGGEKVFGTDGSWQVTEDGAYRMADIYDGETYDASRNPAETVWRAAAPEKLRTPPKNILATYGLLCRRHEVLRPVKVTQAPGGERIYDFGQNFAGVIGAVIKNAKKGDVVTFRHAEVLKKDGSLNTDLLRSAKATATYVCRDGDQEYSPRLTYMGFRYVGVTGAAEEDIELCAYAVYSDVARTGEFSCSDERINRLQSNILWGARSNFVDIPTDCPQRDERMGWTGDINVFAQTALDNFDLTRFLEKWLLDVKAEQKRGGGIPNSVPVQGYGFPATMPVMAMDNWGDACITVPWAIYRARGDASVLREMYPTMKRYVKACRFWAGFGLGKKRYIWHTPAVFHFGDWLAPDLPKMSQWQKRSRWTATASLYRTNKLLSRIAGVLGEAEDAKSYARYADKVADAYMSVFTDGKGRLLEEFQTAYVLPLYFGMFPEEHRRAAADNLASLCERGGWRIATGFPGTPFILFALADNGRADAAYNMLMCDECPSWLYEVKAGGTTIWERWDAVRPDGDGNTGAEDGTGGMISFNHYASGAVGDFFYRRIAGIEPTEAGYKTFAVRPLVGGGLTGASAKLTSPYGEIKSAWSVSGGIFTLKVSVPVSTECVVTLPSGRAQSVGSGDYEFTEKI